MSETILQLCSAHRQELQASGLTDATIEAAGIYSEHDRRKLAAMLNRKQWSAKLGGAIVYPYRDEAGAVVLYRVEARPCPGKRQRQGGQVSHAKRQRCAGVLSTGHA